MADDAFNNGGKDVRRTAKQPDANDERRARVQFPAAIATKSGDVFAVPGRAGLEIAVDGSAGHDIVQAGQGRGQNQEGFRQVLAVGRAVFFKEVEITAGGGLFAFMAATGFSIAECDANGILLKG